MGEKIDAIIKSGNEIIKSRKISDGKMLEGGADIDTFGRIEATKEQVEQARWNMDIEKFCANKTLTDIYILKDQIDTKIMEIGRKIDPTEDNPHFLFKLAQNDPEFSELGRQSSFLFEAINFLKNKETKK